jgi:hypothetical protein
VEDWVANLIKTADGTVAFPDHLTDEEIAERVRSHAELAELGISRSPRATPVTIDPLLPVNTPTYARPEWEPPLPRPQKTWAQRYWDDYRERSNRRFYEVYGRFLGRRPGRR